MVEGETGLKKQKNMKMLMPTHTKKIKQYTNKKPIFSFYGVEDYLTGMFNLLHNISVDMLLLVLQKH